MAMLVSSAALSMGVQWWRTGLVPFLCWAGATFGDAGVAPAFVMSSGGVAGSRASIVGFGAERVDQVVAAHPPLPCGTSAGHGDHIHLVANCWVTATLYQIARARDLANA